MMTISLAFLMLATGQVAELRAETMLAQAFEMPKDLFYLVQSPSGTMFCDKGLKRRQARRFDKRYGSRVNRLASVIAAREGLGWGTARRAGDQGSGCTLSSV